MVRRVGNKALPEQTGTLKKRDAKAEEKKDGKKNGHGEAKPAEEQTEPVERDEKGRLVLCQKDFENTLIVHFKTLDQDAEKDVDYKVSWKDIDEVITKKFECLKTVYSRGDKYEGDIAISSYKLNKAQFAELSTLKDVEVVGKKFSFEETKGEELKDFWQKQGGHFQYCVAPKLRKARSVDKKAQQARREEKQMKEK